MNRILREQALNETSKKMELNAQRLSCSMPEISEEDSANANSSTFIVAQTPYHRRDRRYLGTKKESSYYYVTIYNPSVLASPNLYFLAFEKILRESEVVECSGLR